MEEDIRAGLVGGVVADSSKVNPKVAEFIDKLFQGRHPSALPKYYYQGKFIINLKTANILQLQLPSEVTAQAKIIR